MLFIPKRNFFNEEEKYMTQTAAIFLATALVVLATLIPTYVISKRSAVSEDDWAVADRSLPLRFLSVSFLLSFNSAF